MTNNNLFTAAPMTCLDGPDAQGVRAEVRVIKGYSTILSMKESKGAFQVEFLNPKSQEYTCSGWIWRKDEKLLEMAEQAYKDKVPLHFRIEQRRQDHIGRAIPISELLPPNDAKAAKENTRRSVAALKFNENDEWVFGTRALTNPDEDPGGFHSALDHTPEPRGRKPQNNIIEGPPYASFNPDGSLNVGGPRVSVFLNFANFLFEWEREHSVGLSEQWVRFLSRRMCEIANELQLRIYRGELLQPDYSLGSHTRARAIIYDTIRNYHPITPEVLEGEETVKSWIQNVTEKSHESWMWAIASAGKAAQHPVPEIDG